MVPMRKELEVLLAMKLFAKDLGVPKAIITDSSAAKTLHDVRSLFCINIGSTLKILEESTPWANLVELYIDLLKSSIKKDIKSSNCLIHL